MHVIYHDHLWKVNSNPPSSILNYTIWTSVCDDTQNSERVRAVPRLFAKVCSAQCSTSRLALGSPGCRRRHHTQNIFKNLIMLYFWKAQGPRTSKLIFPTVKYTNTNSQIHKYSVWKSARNTKHMKKCVNWQHKLSRNETAFVYIGEYFLFGRLYLVQRWANSVLMNKSEYEGYSTSQKLPNTNINIIWLPNIYRIQIRIIFGFVNSLLAVG